MDNMLTCTENRELSWLRFNERVLEEAEDERVPLCERLSFLSIFQSNLDEFFMVRIGSLHDQMLLDKEARENKTNMTPGEQIDAAVSRIRTLCDRRDRTYADVLKKLEDEGISIVNFRQISSESEQYLAKIFREDYLPLLSTYVVGKSRRSRSSKTRRFMPSPSCAREARRKKSASFRAGRTCSRA